jgi:hypothetical protein
MHVDYKQVQRCDVSATDTDDNQIEVDGYIIPVLIDESEVAALLAAYDQASATSPSEADSRIIARLVLDALKKIVEG